MTNWDANLYSIGDFAELTRTNRSILRYYEEMDILHPIYRGDNHYRYYSVRQLATLNTIRVLRSFGLPNSEIKELIAHRTPELAIQKLDEIKASIVTKMDDLFHLQKLIYAMYSIVQSGIGADVETIDIRQFQSEPIILGKQNQYEYGETSYDALLAFYRDMSGRCHPTDLMYPVWGMFAEERIKKGDYACPDRFYLCSPNGQERRPAATYAVGHMRAGYGQGTGLYKRIIEYIEQNDFEICGDAYEEYPLNEFCITDDQNYLLRIMITVRKK